MSEKSFSLLIVEDVLEMLELLNYSLGQQKGLFISGLARNAFEARFEVSRRRPDVILLDEILGVDSSVELVMHWQKDPITSKIPIIFMTSFQASTSLHRALPQGVCLRVTKPRMKMLREDCEKIRDFIFSLLSCPNG